MCRRRTTRRLINILVSIANIALLVACARAPTVKAPLRVTNGQITVRGVVFDDQNRNGSREADEPGLGGVKVSNGIDIVQTNAVGQYILPIEGEAIIFVIKPRDWMIPLDQNNLPRFYYIHKPFGSPDTDFWYSGVEATGSLPKSIDFPLYKKPEPEQFEIIVLADPQPSTLEELAFFSRDTVNELVGSNAAFGMSLGDLVWDDLTLFEALNQIQGQVGIPWFNVLGNHDMNFMSPDDTYSDETFERVYGPPTYAFEYAAVHFVILDTVIWNGFAGYREDGLPSTRNYIGGLREEHMAFLRNYLAMVPQEELVVLAMHIPLEGEGRRLRVPEKDQIFEILDGHPHTFSMSGHTHLQRHWFFDLPSGGVHHHYNVGAASGSWYRGAPDEIGIPHATMRDGTPNGYSIISFSGNTYSIRFKVSRRPADYQMNIYLPDRVSKEALSKGVYVLVNVFSGSEKSAVEMRVVKNNHWITMNRVIREDPLLLELNQREEKSWQGDWSKVPKAGMSFHLWAVTLPVDLEKGIHLIEVRTTDMFGQTFWGRRSVLVE